MDDESFRLILRFFNLSWRGYRKVRKGVKKRIARHTQEYGCRKISDYLLLLQENPEIADKARKLLTVPISRFFRDERLWEVISASVIPRLVQEIELSGRRPVRVWSAGCSCGEEAFSLKILWDQIGKRFLKVPPIEIWATDTNPEVLEKARAGIYPQSSLRNLSSYTLQDYFIPVSNGFSIREGFKGEIHWIQHDFISESPPCMNFDIIFLRNNLLTYYEPPTKIRAFVQILTALGTGRFLIIGNNEEIHTEGLPLKRCSEYRCIFEKCLAPLSRRDRGGSQTPNGGSRVARDVASPRDEFN
ncbi:Methylase of chemotaxis methyl-accepting protein [Syntrophobacter sp. SbD1]|nr:Methylase of chemotaxis methyl-accepting protein [Syntrophobacter sp. SbD1]